jgi:hypothetical protein
MTRRIPPRVGLLEVDCEPMATAEEGQSLIILSGAPGTETQHQCCHVAQTEMRSPVSVSKT